LPTDMDPHRELLHRLNGQLLLRLNMLLKKELPEEPRKWDCKNWIINVILLHRSLEQVSYTSVDQGKYTAQLETSATFHKGTLFDTSKDFDPSKVALLDLPVPLDRSFSGYSITTSDVVWIDDLMKLEKDPKHPLAKFYRSFGLVGVRTPADRPIAEYVFPLFVQIGLNHTIIGVLNMEYFAPRDGRPSPCPFDSENQLFITDIVTRLLNAHSPFLLIAKRPEMAAALAEKSRASMKARDRFLGIHKMVLDKHNLPVSSLRRRTNEKLKKGMKNPS